MNEGPFAIVFEGRPISWDRTAIGKDGKAHNRPRALAHRRALATAMQFSPSRRAFEGLVALEVVFDYGRNETRIQIRELSRLEARDAYLGQADLDNLVKQVMEAAQAAGIVRNDVQIASLTARKTKRPKPRKETRR